MSETLTVMWYAWVTLTFSNPPGAYSFPIEQRFEDRHACIVAAQEWVDNQKVPKSGEYTVFCRPKAVDLKAEYDAKHPEKENE